MANDDQIHPRYLALPAGAIMVCVVWLVKIVSGYDLPPELVAALTSLVTYVALSVGLNGNYSLKKKEKNGN